MKKLILTLLLMAFSSILVIVQGCLPDGISFPTQSPIDNFQTIYPGSTKIEGNVTIDGENIHNLNGFIMLSSFGGGLLINNVNSLFSLTGFDNVNFIGGYLEQWGNATLSGLTSLCNLNSIGSYLQIAGNLALASIEGLDNLIKIPGDLMNGGNCSFNT